jgi:hypothetical protein
VRDASVPTPAIVDSRLIEAPFEVAISASQARRHDDSATQAFSVSDGRDVSGDASTSAAQTREQQRLAKEAAREATRQAKISAKRMRAEEKRVARESKRKAEVAQLPQVEPVQVAPVHVAPEPVAPTQIDSNPPAPRATSSFDELMGYTQP